MEEKSGIATLPRLKEKEGWKKIHGLCGSEDWAAPFMVTEFDVEARPCFTNTKAHEYQEDPEVLPLKIKVLADMIRKSKKCVAYTGAGISTAAGIADYASKAKEQSVVEVDKPKLRNWFDARPTFSHRVLVTMYKKNMLQHWIQQNHDSLPQKAGLPQHMINEIHGSLHDPANPIVPIEGSLRDDLFSWMREWEDSADLVLALGTSMSGMNSDRVPATCAKRFVEKGKGLGIVIVNLQQTVYDNVCSLRIFEKIDVVMKMLVEELGIADNIPAEDKVYVPDIPEDAFVEQDVYLVPFDQQGYLLSEKKRGDKKNYQVWDLHIGKKIKLTGGPYQGDVGEIMEKNVEGHYRVRFTESMDMRFKVKRRPFNLWLGSWWIESATKGYGITPESKMIPFINVD